MPTKKPFEFEVYPETLFRCGWEEFAARQFAAIRRPVIEVRQVNLNDQPVSED